MARPSKAERAEALRQKAERLEAEAHLAERMKDAATIPTCPACGGRTFKVYSYTTVAQSILYGDEKDEEEWGDDYESGDHTDVNESATCAECDSDAQEVLEQHGWTFYDGPRPAGDHEALLDVARTLIETDNLQAAIDKARAVLAREERNGHGG